jgi:hypothetical protein
MANEWKWLRGRGETVKITVGDTAVTKGEPLKISSNLAVAAGDGDTVDLVACHDADASAQLTAIKPIGDVFEVVTGADLALGARAYMAASYKVDAGSSGNISNIQIEDYNPTSGGIAHVSVVANSLTAYTHTG